MNSMFYAFIRRLKSLPEGHRLIGSRIHQFGDGFTYGDGNGDGNGRMDFAYFQQDLEHGDGELYGDHQNGNSNGNGGLQ